jgi:hypothetical protein
MFIKESGVCAWCVLASKLTCSRFLRAGSRSQGTLSFASASCRNGPPLRSAPAGAGLDILEPTVLELNTSELPDCLTVI